MLVWFHGGSFVIGASSQPVYDGALLAAEQQVVVVSANYRLGAFGFLDARPFGGVANCGVRDAICALEWVRDNIAAFGGDPARVVAFGESAGGGLVLHALASPRGARSARRRDRAERRDVRDARRRAGRDRASRRSSRKRA